MSLTPAVCSVNDVQGLHIDPAFHPSLWGDFFLKYKLPTALKHGYMTERAEVLKEEVRKMLKAANQIKIITLQRLGLDNHYENEINELLSFVYNSDYDDKDMYLVSLRFYLLRKHGYYVSSGACFEPQYSLSRVIATKMTACITILDDLMDTYSTTEEAVLLAEAIYRWEENAAELLPEYMNDFYLYLLKTIDSCEDELGPTRSFRTFYLKEVLKVLVRGNSQEIKWRDENYVPETISEHLEHSGASVGAFQVACSLFVGMGDNITKEILDWLLTYPELLKSFTTIARLLNDIASTKREEKGGHHASTVQCYMLTHGTTMDDACEKIKELTEDAWKDMMELYLAPKLIAQTVVDVARTADYMYKETDAFTFSHTIKDMITKLFVEPILLF